MNIPRESQSNYNKSLSPRNIINVLMFTFLFIDCSYKWNYRLKITQYLINLPSTSQILLQIPGRRAMPGCILKYFIIILIKISVVVKAIFLANDFGWGLHTIFLSGRSLHMRIFWGPCARFFGGLFRPFLEQTRPFIRKIVAHFPKFSNYFKLL